MLDYNSKNNSTKEINNVSQPNCLNELLNALYQMFYWKQGHQDDSLYKFEEHSTYSDERFKAYFQAQSRFFENIQQESMNQHLQ